MFVRDSLLPVGVRVRVGTLSRGVAPNSRQGVRFADTPKPVRPSGSPSALPLTSALGSSVYGYAWRMRVSHVLSYIWLLTPASSRLSAGVCAGTSSPAPRAPNKVIHSVSCRSDAGRAVQRLLLLGVVAEAWAFVGEGGCRCAVTSPPVLATHCAPSNTILESVRTGRCLLVAGFGLCSDHMPIWLRRFTMSDAVNDPRVISVSPSASLSQHA
eukprot:8601-Prymnesium_polylepis.2